MSEKWKRRMLEKVKPLVEIIRREKVVSSGRLSLLSGLAPSTLQAYRALILELAKDIVFEDGEFRVVEK